MSGLLSKLVEVNNEYLDAERRARELRDKRDSLAVEVNSNGTSLAKIANALGLSRAGVQSMVERKTGRR